MKRSTWYIIFLLIGLLAVWSFFRIQGQTETDNLLLENQRIANSILNKIDSVLGNQSINQEIILDILQNQENERREANITTKEFVDEFYSLVNKTHSVFDKLTSGVNRQDEIVDNQEKIINLLEPNNISSS